MPSGVEPSLDDGPWVSGLAGQILCCSRCWRACKNHVIEGCMRQACASHEVTGTNRSGFSSTGRRRECGQTLYFARFVSLLKQIGRICSWVTDVDWFIRRAARCAGRAASCKQRCRQKNWHCHGDASHHPAPLRHLGPSQADVGPTRITPALGVQHVPAVDDQGLVHVLDQVHGINRLKLRPLRE